MKMGVVNNGSLQKQTVLVKIKSCMLASSEVLWNCEREPISKVTGTGDGLMQAEGLSLPHVMA